jgi:molybdopterin-containing oxidoreductase family iron-sulfur binding subunit
MPPLNGLPVLDRRAALKLLAGAVALPAAGCAKPREEIVPYVEMPEGLVPGELERYATTVPLGGYGRGVIAIAVDGRPIKIEGNPKHPASLGATDTYAEAEIMELYDPSRSKAPRHGDEISTWDDFAGALQRQLDHETRRGGAGLRIITNRVTSPTLLAQIGDTLRRFPGARWYRYEPIDDDDAVAGAVQAFGRRVSLRARLAEARVIVSLDADPIGPGPQQIANANAFAKTRRPGPSFSRLYAVEPDLSLTGANADHRLALHPSLIPAFAWRLAQNLGGKTAPGKLPADAARFADAVAADLRANNGKAIVLVGRRQMRDVHALAHWINAQINAPLDFIDPVDPNERTHGESLDALADDLRNETAKTLIIIGANPAYDTPPELGIADGIRRAAFSARMGLRDDETAALCQWHLPQSHPLENWSDLRSSDGTASLVQPLLRPLYDTRTPHDLLASINSEIGSSPYDRVRGTWRDQAQGDFETWWRAALRQGVIEGSAAKPVTLGAPRAPEPPASLTEPAPVLLLRPSASIWDGCFANNPWLQECPEPLTKSTWGNDLLVSPADAAAMSLTDGDVLRITHSGFTLDCPARVFSGQTPGVFGAAIGYGRRRCGAIGNGIGTNFLSMRRRRMPWQIDNITLAKLDRSEPSRVVQHQVTLEGEAKDLLPILSVAELAEGKRPPQTDGGATLYPPHRDDTYAWSMVIDDNACIGCNACVVACQAENNVPVVGPDEVARGRIMHWLRIDTFFDGPGSEAGFQPVACMHCEHAPCEPVCPVAASVHDGEGLNVQVYNRCIGTRFCQANCPYKVRRFNWFGYADGQEYADLGEEPIKASRNPDVTVRARGVMEKCTYCVQRISRARRAAETNDKAIERVVTACQAACPTRAIHFGNRNSPTDEINRLREEPRHHVLLGELGTRPRTTYLAKLRNPNPSLTGAS